MLMSHHGDQIESVLCRALQEVLSRGLNDPRVRGLISVTGITLSVDKRDATVMISVLPAERGSSTLHGLKHAAQHLRTEVGKRVRLRRMPRLEFKLDRSLKVEADVLAAIDRAVEADRERTATPEDADGTEEQES
ncbi:MAG: 30S ribosome-binding factor RbfA [Planctomycetes bacterium]|nr:30S ribosome-binding factor RbfA [Planctomycetota bacterium]